MSDTVSELTKAQRRLLLQDLAVTCRRHNISAQALKQIVAEHDLPGLAPPKFVEGDRVAWSHKLAGLHGAGSVLNVDALPVDVHTQEAAADGANEAQSTAHPTPILTILRAGNARSTTWIVAVDDEHANHPRVLGAAGTHPDENVLELTGDELVKVEAD